ncbi:ADP-ribosylation factor-like protein 13A [Gymnodraco acuticeps]|uniref:ADP-ribosylation factor-like protein 13A n=1 Tax=Gymnodraco acuticeps TaxID=8218 RepID=A0A6P8TTY1_GYMAC|nr:ADP-ribosylation factor-like protein 13A [Gymnodraco acuticeps]
MDIDLLLYGFQRRWWPLCSPQANMFNLMTNCCAWFSKIQEPIRKVTILVVGLDKAGKTASIKGMLKVPHTVETGPTHGCVKNELRVENYMVTLLDVGGSAETRGAWMELSGEAHGIIFVVDSCDRQRIKEVKEVLAELLKQPRVAGKPVLVLANKQDKMNALLGSELIESLSLEKLVNQSRSLCHIEPCSALTDLRRWSEGKTLRGLRWLLRAIALDYPELCSRVAQDSKRPLEPGERKKTWKTGKVRKKTKGERMRSSKSDLRQFHRPKEKAKKTKGEGKLQPIRDMLQKENTLKKKLRKKKPVKVKEGEKDQAKANEQEEEEGDGNGEHENSSHTEKASSALIPPKKTKPKRKTKVKEDALDVPESNNNGEKPLKAKGEKRRKKKVVKVKRKNKINTEEMSGTYSQPVDLSATFDLYRKAIMALKERQDQGQRA